MSTALPSRSRFYHRTVVLATFTLLAASSLLLSHVSFSRDIGELSIVPSAKDAVYSFKPPKYLSNQFSWNELEPSETLAWTNCYQKFQCARLIVPLNYSDPCGTKATIALTRFPSSLPPTSPEYRGPILLNPGGPGGSGISFALHAGELISTIIGPEFDILGFDPRGVGHSTPQASFFETELEKTLWDGLRDRLSVLNASADGLARAWAVAKINGQLAWERQPDVLGHINTDQTARDMLSIVQAHGREKLSYWGFSYGSVLGATFASMFPDKVERLVIDGVVDIENYYEALWSTNLKDASKTMDYFYTSCHSAGPDVCPFYAPTPELIAANLTQLYASVSARPIPVRTATSYGLVDYDRLRTSIFSSLYNPWATYPALASALAALAQGNGTLLFEMYDPPKFQCECGPEAAEKGALGKEAFTAIACNDGDAVSESFEDFQQYFETETRKSEWAEIWSEVRVSCVGWPHKHKRRFRGPFEGNTSFPILAIGNTADPVTPLWAAKKTAKGFTDSVVLTQDSPGHCSLAAPSVCTHTYIRDYFVKGSLPPPDTVCSVIGTPFSSPGSSSALDTMASEKQQKTFEDSLSTLSGDEHMIYEAARKLSMLYATLEYGKFL